MLEPLDKRARLAYQNRVININNRIDLVINFYSLINNI